MVPCGVVCDYGTCCALPAGWFVWTRGGERDGEGGGVMLLEGGVMCWEVIVSVGGIGGVRRVECEVFCWNGCMTVGCAD